jgi:hypothetical protein
MLVSQLDDWVLCRIYKKINKLGAGERSMDCEDSVEDAVAAYPTHAAAAMAAAVAGGGRAAHHNGNSYTSLIHHHHEDNFLDGFMTAEDTGLSAGASSLSQLAAAARAAAPADTKQLLVPSSSTTPFNWLDASALAILPPSKRFHGYNSGGTSTDGGGTSLSSPSERNNLAAAGAVDSGACSGGANAIVPTFLNPLGVQGATTYHHHAIFGTPVTPEAAAAAATTATCGFQHPYQLSGVNWNP